MSKSKLLLPTLLALLLSASPALAQQDKEDLRRAIESLKAAVNQLQVAVTELERAANPAPLPIVGRPPSEQPNVQGPSGNPDDTIVYINFADVQYHFKGCPRIKPGNSFERTLAQAKVPFMRCMTCGEWVKARGATADESSIPTTDQRQKELAPVNTTGTVKVKGYYRKDGTYVRPHTRSAPGTKKKEP